MSKNDHRPMQQWRVTDAAGCHHVVNCHSVIRDEDWVHAFRDGAVICMFHRPAQVSMVNNSNEEKADDQPETA